MKAVVFSEHGSPNVLRYTEVPEPRIGTHEVLVRVRACAVNHRDLLVRQGATGSSVSFPHILGSDIAGEVAKVGEGVSNVRPGDPVLLAPGISCGHCEECTAGRDNFCRDYTVFGSRLPGGYAEFVKAPASNVLPMPANLTFEEAAAIPFVFMSAWHMLITRAALRPAEQVLVIGAASGVGSAAIQIAKAAGARVIATAGSESKFAKAKELGADDVLLYAGGELAKDVRRLTKNRGVDVVFEHVGQATWEQSILSLATGGRLVTCGATTGREGKINITYLFFNHLSIIGSFMGSKSELYSVLELVERGLLKPVVDCVMPLERAADAHARLEHRQQFGKIILQVP